MHITREKTEDEKNEYKELHEVTAETVFMDRCNKFAQTYVEQHKPYCKKCAIEEFRMEKQNLYNKLKLQYQREFTEKEKPFVDLANNFSIEKYGKIEHFDHVGTERKNERRREGGDVWFELVVNKSYACKAYGHGCTVSISQSEMNEEELAEEQKRIIERKAKIGAGAGTSELPVAGDELKNRLPVGSKTQTPTLNPSGN